MSDYTSYLKNMPVVPDIAAKILSIPEDKIDISFRELEQTIKMDPGLSAKILKVSNSAMYARQREVKNLQMAITLLGFKTIKSLVLLVTASNAFSKNQNSKFYQFYWKHAIINAFIARELCIKSGNRSLTDECFLAALLHDIGQVALYNANAERYDQVLQMAAEHQMRISQVEKDLYSTNHRDVGAAVLRDWNFPDIYIDAASEHGSPNITSSHKKSILIISVADFLASNIDLYHDNPIDIEVMRDILKQTNIEDAVLIEIQESFLETIKEDPLFQECQSLFKLS